MLVLTRKPGESILIGADIVLTVLDPHPAQPRDTVRLGIQAPRSVRVGRAELHPEKPRALNSELGNTGLAGASN